MKGWNASRLLYFLAVITLIIAIIISILILVKKNCEDKMYLKRLYYMGMFAWVAVIAFTVLGLASRKERKCGYEKDDESSCESTTSY